MKRSLLCLTIIGVAWLASTSWHASADPAPNTNSTAKAAAKPADWKSDPVCQMVFFAVLEGLYTDGVPDDIVDTIVPREAKPGASPMVRNFVPTCPICHPVYEAFALYQKRPMFTGEGKHNTLGAGGLAPEIGEALKSNDLPRRVKNGLNPLVNKYVSARLAKMNLSPEQKQEWSAKLIARTKQGDGLYLALRSTPEGRELGWNFYGGCGACGGTEAACKAVLVGEGK